LFACPGPCRTAVIEGVRAADKLSISPAAHTAAVRLLVVEDEPQLAEIVATGLREQGFAVDVSADGSDALDKAWATRYDVVILDRDLPRVHGDAVCRKLAAAEDGPRILMLTAAGDLEDRVAGLDLGADDYLAKPFAFSELVARVRALSRRPSTAVPPVLEGGGVRLDRGRMTASREGRELRLTPKEAGVLELLLTAQGRIVSAEDLLERAWDANADPFTNAVRIAVSNLRRKLGDPPVIETVIGAGYRIEP
jgi:DNA-binding response OmpR family regulator